MTVLAAHAVVGQLRQWPSLATVVDHPPRVLMRYGEPLRAELRRAGLTHADLLGLLRQHGIFDLARMRHLIFEQQGGSL